jgi:hypothetical protein
MMCLPVSNTMVATKSHKRRAWIFSPASGTVVITQGREADSYKVEEQTEERAGNRVFLLCHSVRGDVYEVRIFASGFSVCSGHFCGKHKACKHRDAVHGILAEGHFGEAKIVKPVCLRA